MPSGGPRFLKLTDVAEVLNVTTRQVYALVRSGDLRGIQVGGRNQWRVEDVELEDYIKRQYARTTERDPGQPVEQPGAQFTDRLNS
jgi:excisionase family DNA binding protein